MARSENFAEHMSDDVLEDGLIPVVLRVAPDCFEASDLMRDVPGSSDARADAWMTRLDLDPECLEVFTGKRWAPVEEYGEIDPASAIDAQPNDDRDEDDPDDKEFLHYFKNYSPLKPELL